MSLLVWLPLINDIHNLGTSNPSISLVSGNTWASSGKIGSSSLTLTKLLTILPTSSCMTGAKEISYSYWVKVNTAWSANWLDGIRWIETNGSATSTARQEFYTNCTLIGTWYKGGAISGKAFTPGVWTHLAATFNYNTGEAKFYINGVLNGTTTNVDTTYYCRGDFYIGDNGTDICENDVRIYDHCLSAAEVREISLGLVLHYKLDNTPQGEIINAYNMSSWDTSTTRGGFSAWGPSGHAGTSGNNTDRLYIYRQNRTYSYYISENAGTGKYFIFYQSPAFSGGYRSLSAIIKEENSLPINETICTPGWNANVAGTGHAPINIWTRKISLGNGFYLCQVDGFYLDGSNDLVSIAVLPGYKIYISEIWLENDKQVCSDVLFPIEYIEDSSGYNHNGTINGNIAISSDTNRYNYSALFDGVDDSITVPYNTICPENIFTLNLWFKKDALGSKNYETLFGGPSGFEMDTRSGSATALSLYMASTRSGKRNLVTGLSLGNWYMITMTRDGTKEKYYVNGIFLSEIDAKSMPNGTYRIGAWASNTGLNYYGLISDFRIYCTALDADAIRQLYEVGAKIDNKQNLHTFELIETDKQEITKQGQVKGLNLLETYLPLYDKNIYTEPDGSTWIHIFHHNNPTASKFNEPTLDWTTGKYLDADRWYDVDQAVYYTLSPYEFMVKLKTTSSAAETKYRWVLTANPLTAVWADVKPGTVTFNTSSGYTSSSHGGMYLLKSSNLHMCIANSSNGNWYGGIGAVAAYQGGIPGYPNTTVTSGYIDLYVRVYNGTKIINNIGISSSEFIEL